MNSTQTPFEAQFGVLSITAVIFSSLSALYGAYVILFILALWSIRRREEKGHSRLKIVTIVLFVVLLIHYICRAITLVRARRTMPADDEEGRFTVPLLFATAATTTVAAFIFDGLLAWRLYVLYGQPRWALYLPPIIVVINALVGLTGDFQNFSFYRNAALYNGRLEIIAFKINVAWAWCTFATNTIMTTAIIGKILHASNQAKRTIVSSFPYNLLMEAIIESALVTWVGLLLYEISSTAPTHGRITTDLNIGYVIACILPIFFGISQALITVRFGLVYNPGDTTEPCDKNNGKPSRSTRVDTLRFAAHPDTTSMTTETSIEVMQSEHKEMVDLSIHEAV
ncbi:hypothetical protein BDW22DRAFT_207940 [Trametopsis cervina]|nr:hypothetical protein BDW22DRAFT_207940 [Trametopsis cervina]